jgi:eukaryotic-like serine/threonine-protein kinase
MPTLTKAGRYEISGELGRGAMGVVYHATDPVIGRAVAVKTLQLSEEGTGLTRAELLARFQTEARAAGNLTHPNIVVVYDAGEEEGLFFITMELVEGKSLQNLLDAGQMFPLPRVLRIMEQACSALQFAHDRNIVHRDIKPANLMLTPDDTVKVTDFGTAKILQFGTVQQTAHVMGTPSYMSPEQIKGKVVDGRSDIFSLGVVLYEMVTGEKPFPGQNITTVIYKIVNEEPTAPRDIDSSIHPGLSAIIMKSLAKEPGARYQDCRELFEDLRNYRAYPGAQNPNATLPLGGSPQRDTLPSISPNDPQFAATARALASRGSNASQTPLVRRTGVIARVPESRKTSAVATVLAAIFLLAVIAFGAQKIRPAFQAARQRNGGNNSGFEINGEASAVKPATVDKPSEAVSPPVVATDAPAESNPAPVKSPEPAGSHPAFAGANSLSPVAAEYKGRVEQAATDRHLRNRLTIKGSGMTLMLSGKLRTAEHSELLKFLRNAPAGVQVVDDIQYDDTADVAASGEDSSKHPAAKPGLAAIHIITNVIGATAYLGTDDASAGRQCETPCGFAGLQPGNYNLQVLKPGFQPLRTVLQLEAGKSVDQKIQLEPLKQGLFITSEPAGADVFINGDKQSGQTPLTLPLAPGKYNLVLRLPGYDAYSGPVQVRDDGQSKVQAELHAKGGRVAWAQVESNPIGAEIWIDGVATGQRTPARVEIPSGIHNITLKLDGFRNSRNAIQASDGGTVRVSQSLLKTR